MNVADTTLMDRTIFKDLPMLEFGTNASTRSKEPSRTIRTRLGNRVEIRATERASFTEYHCTGIVETNTTVSAAAEDVFVALAAELAEEKVQTIQEKVYGLSSVEGEVLRCRQAAYGMQELDTTVPVTWLQGTPLRDCEFVGVQVWGIAPKAGKMTVTTVDNPVTGRGRLWTAPNFRMLHLPAVMGKRDGVLENGHVAQCDRMFANMGTALRAHGFDYRDVVRTWIYVARLLEWYDDLNRVRTSYYRPAGFGAAGGPAFPASTGIQCKSQNEECLVDVLAVQTDADKGVVVSPILRSPRQDQSFKYGSAFSRGMILGLDGKHTIHISGTASINTAGLSVHLGDAELQSLETLMSIAAILEEQGGSLENITSATLFCKTKEAWEAWQRVSRLLRVPVFPKICVLADVCRDNLLVEMEAVAVI